MLNAFSEPCLLARGNIQEGWEYGDPALIPGVNPGSLNVMRPGLFVSSLGNFFSLYNLTSTFFSCPCLVGKL